MRLLVVIIGNDENAIQLARRLAQAEGRAFDVVTNTFADLARGAPLRPRPDVLLMRSSEFLTACEAGGPLGEVRDRCPEARLLALGSGHLQEIIAVARAGAAGYVCHSTTTHEIADVVRRAVTNSGFALPSSLVTTFNASVVQSPLYSQASLSLGDLSPRERDIVFLAASGMSNLELAQLLHVSENTAKWHANNALRKLGLRSRSQLAAWFRGRIRPITTGGAPSVPGSAC